MNLLRNAVAAATVLVTLAAPAQVVGTLGGGTGSFVTLSSAGLGGGSIATLSGGTVYHTDMPFADIPAGAVFGNSFLAAGPSSGVTATLDFAGAGVGYISFLWGSPDSYNRLTVTTTGGVTTSFDTASLGFGESDGNQAFSQYVQFSATGGSMITALTFANAPLVDAFETANYSISPVPEPQTFALLLAGLGAVAFVLRRLDGGTGRGRSQLTVGFGSGRRGLA